MNYEEVDHRRTALLAYQLWQERGSPDGSSEADWYKAEEMLGIDSRRKVLLFAFAMGPDES